MRHHTVMPGKGKMVCVTDMTDTKSISCTLAIIACLVSDYNKKGLEGDNRFLIDDFAK